MTKKPKNEPAPGLPLLSVREIARRLGKSVRWLRDFEPAKKYGRRVGRSVMWTEEDYRRIVGELPSAMPERILRRAVPWRGPQRTGDEQMAELRSLLHEKRPTRGARRGRRVPPGPG